MRRIAALLAAAVLVTGCAKVVKEQSLGQPYRTTAQYNCNHFAICYGLQFDGKYGFGPSAMCPGTQTNLELRQDYRVWYDNNTVKDESRLVDTLDYGACN